MSLRARWNDFIDSVAYWHDWTEFGLHSVQGCRNPPTGACSVRPSQTTATLLFIHFHSCWELCECSCVALAQWNWCLPALVLPLTSCKHIINEPCSQRALLIGQHTPPLQIQHTKFCCAARFLIYNSDTKSAQTFERSQNTLTTWTFYDYCESFLPIHHPYGHLREIDV